MNKLQKELFSLQDKKYKEFNSSLIPNIEKKKVIGVRTPELRRIAKRIYKEGNYSSFLNSLPHTYQEENIIHSLIINQIDDFNECITYLDQFVSYIDNWAVSDILKPDILIQNKKELIQHIYSYLKSNHPYTLRVGILLLMKYYLKEDYKKEYFNKVVKIKSDDYYVKMMIAWYLAEAYLYHKEDVIIILKEKKLDSFTHNKAIPKMIDSYRIADKEKEYLKTLKK